MTWNELPLWLRVVAILTVVNTAIVVMAYVLQLVVVGWQAS